MSQRTISSGHMCNLTYVYSETAESVKLKQFKILQMVFLLLWVTSAEQHGQIRLSRELNIEERCGMQVMGNKKRCSPSWIWYPQGWNHSYHIFIYHNFTSQYPFCEIAVLCRMTSASAWDPLRVPFELSYYKNMLTLLRTVRSALERPHRKHKQ